MNTNELRDGARRLGLRLLVLAGTVSLATGTGTAGVPASVVINEIHFAPNAAATGALKYEYVELYAKSTTSLAGWELRDLDASNMFDLLYTFPSLVLPANAFLLVVSNAATGDLQEDTNFGDGSGLLIASSLWTVDLANAGDAVALRESSQLHDFVYYDEANTGDPLVDDEAVAENIWKDGAAIDVLSAAASVGRAVALRVDGQTPNEVNPAADAEDLDWMQYSATTGGTPGGPNAGPVGVSPLGQVARGFRGIRPSPVTSGVATFLFALDVPGQVGFDVLDLTGRVVSRRASRLFGAGPSEIAWSTTESSDGRALPAGIYVVRMSIDGRPAGSRKLTLIR